MSKPGRRRLRPIAPARVIPAPTGLAIKTRLHLSGQDERVLRELGVLLDHLASTDLVRAQAGMDWNERKRELTRIVSARWAGSITRATNDLLALRRRNLVAEAASLRAAIKAITSRRGIALGSAKAYRGEIELAGKRTRLDILNSRLDRVEAVLSSGHYPITRGGRDLLIKRHNRGGRADPGPVAGAMERQATSDRGQWRSRQGRWQRDDQGWSRRQFGY